MGACVNRLKQLEIKHLFVTDSITQGPMAGLPVKIVSVAGLLADAIRGLASAN